MDTDTRQSGPHMAPDLAPESPDYTFLSVHETDRTLRRWKSEFGPIDLYPPRRPSNSAGPSARWAVHHRSADATVGLVELAALGPPSHRNLAIWIAPPFRQQGHGTAIGRILLDWAWAHGVERIGAAHDSTASGASELAARLGFLPEGVQRGVPLPGRDAPVDLSHWGLLSRDC